MRHRSSTWPASFFLMAFFLYTTLPSTVVAQTASSEQKTTQALHELFQGNSNQIGNVTLVTRNQNLDELGYELTRIYLTLYNSKRLSVRTARISGLNTPIEALFRSENLFYGKAFPLELQDLACDLNPDSCSRDRTPVPADKLSSVTAHVSGYLPSKPTWNVSPGRALLLPDVKLNADVEWFSIEKDPSRSLAAQVDEDLGGCVYIGNHCLELISFYNRTLGKRIFETSYRGKLFLPVLTMVVSANIATASEFQPSPDVTHSGTIVLKKVKDDPQAEESYKVIDGIESDKAKNAMKDGLRNNRDQNDLVREINASVLKQLNTNIVPKISVKAFQTPTAQPIPGAVVLPEDVQESNRNLHSLIALPDYLQTLPFPSRFQSPVSVGVVDSYVDGSHCAFNGNLEVRNFTAPSLGPQANCDLKTNGNDTVDHGTHVTGLVGAIYKAHENNIPIGLNPYARIHTLEIDFSGPNDENIARSIKQLVQENQIKVVNMSFGYLIPAQNPDLQPTDVLERPIAGLQNTTLFVAAAGNAGADKSYICDLRPACFDLPNVIAVAGIDRDEKDPTFLANGAKSYSNFGKRIHIAAVGKDVFSTITSGRFGTLTGTSQAAPQVAAVASLLFSKNPNLTPVAVKNRLIYCSDLMPNLKDRLFGGRLNAECTLDNDYGRLTTKSAPDALQHGQFEQGSVFKFVDEDSADFVLPIALVRSINLDLDSLTYTVFYSTRSRSDARLERVSNLVWKDPNDAFNFRPERGRATRIKVEQIVKYVSPLK